MYVENCYQQANLQLLFFLSFLFQGQKQQHFLWPDGKGIIHEHTSFFYPGACPHGWAAVLLKLFFKKRVCVFISLSVHQHSKKVSDSINPVVKVLIGKPGACLMPIQKLFLQYSMSSLPNRLGIVITEKQQLGLAGHQKLCIVL